MAAELPDPISTFPLSPLDVPLLNARLPLTPDPPEFGLWIRILPEVVAVPAPLIIDT